MDDGDRQVQMWEDDVAQTVRAVEDPDEVFVQVSKLHRKDCRTIAYIYGRREVLKLYRMLRRNQPWPKGMFIPSPAVFLTLDQGYGWWTQGMEKRPKTTVGSLCKVCRPDELLIEEQFRRSW